MYKKWIAARYALAMTGDGASITLNSPVIASSLGRDNPSFCLQII
jgi:hypothetical protein